MGQLEELENFVRIAEAGGIGRAAEQLGLAKSAVSRRLVDLESRLGSRLIARTTRKWHLTEAGQRCYEQALRVLDANAELQASVNLQDHQLQGTLRIAAPLSFGVAHLAPVIEQFSNLHPGLSIELELSDRFVNLVETGMDLALRIGELADSSLKARKLAPMSLCIVAAPSYLQQAGEPKSPEALKQHRLLLYAGSNQNTLLLTGPDKTQHHIDLAGKLKANNGDFLNAMAVQGYGIAFSPRFICWQDIAQGNLKVLLPEYTMPDRALYAVYPSSRFTSQRVRVFIDFLVAYFGKQPSWEKSPTDSAMS